MEKETLLEPAGFFYENGIYLDSESSPAFIKRRKLFLNPDKPSDIEFSTESAILVGFM